jgi:hypothetical protein
LARHRCDLPSGSPASGPPGPCTPLSGKPARGRRRPWPRRGDPQRGRRPVPRARSPTRGAGRWPDWSGSSSTPSRTGAGNGTGELIVLLTTITDPGHARADELATAFPREMGTGNGHDQLKTTRAAREDPALPPARPFPPGDLGLPGLHAGTYTTECSRTCTKCDLPRHFPRRASDPHWSPHEPGRVAIPVGERPDPSKPRGCTRSWPATRGTSRSRSPCR